MGNLRKSCRRLSNREANSSTQGRSAALHHLEWKDVLENSDPLPENTKNRALPESRRMRRFFPSSLSTRDNRGTTCPLENVMRRIQGRSPLPIEVPGDKTSRPLMAWKRSFWPCHCEGRIKVADLPLRRKLSNISRVRPPFSIFGSIV